MISKMLVVLLQLFFLKSVISGSNFNSADKESIINLKTILNDIVTDSYENTGIFYCTRFILKNYFNDEKSISIISMSNDDEWILKLVNSITKFNIVNRNLNKNFFVDLPNEMYLIIVDDEETFLENFQKLPKDRTWRPRLKFLIIFKHLNEENVKQVFDILLKYHVVNVLITNGTSDPNLLSYNPYENYACGKYYTGIINYGKCINVTADLYPIKMVTGLRNCVFNVSVPHWPPYAIDPGRTKRANKPTGLEQYTLNLLAEIEKFHINFQYNYDPDVFSTVNENMEATGPMEMLQKNVTDLMIGGLLLTPMRGDAFSYIYGHLDFTDDIRIVVQKASLKPIYTLFYLEFDLLVWILLALVFLLFAAMITYLLREKDRVYILLKLLDYFFLHGYKLRFRFRVRCIFIFWIWFTYLVNSYYQTIMMSFTMKPTVDPQISDLETLLERGLQPCVSRAIRNFLLPSHVLQSPEIESCQSILGSVETVCKSKSMYTVVIHAVYTYNKNKFVDESGDDAIYVFRTPLAKVIYGIYSHKGFPIKERFHKLTLRIREAGLIRRHWNHQIFIQGLFHKIYEKPYHSRFVIPWHLYVVGIFLCLVAFAYECNTKNKIITQESPRRRIIES